MAILFLVYGRDRDENFNPGIGRHPRPVLGSRRGRTLLKDPQLRLSSSLEDKGAVCSSQVNETVTYSSQVKGDIQGGQ